MGAWEEIVDYTVPSNTTSVTLNNFGTITKDDFIKVSITQTNPSSSTGTYVSIYPNNQTNESLYTRQLLIGTGSSVVAVRGNVNLVSWANASSTSQAFVYIKLSENNVYNSFANHNDTISSSVVNGFTYTTSSGVTFSSGITSLTFETNTSNNLGANSRIQIYKLTAEKVADVIVTSNTTQVNITGLDIKKGDEYLLVADLENSTGTFSQISLTPNDLTTLSNYYYQVVAAFGSSTYAERSNIPRIMFLPANLRTLSYVHIKLSNIGAYTHQSYGITEMGTSSVGIGNEFASSTFENLTSINKLNVISSLSNAIKLGSRFELYKLYEGGN